MIQTCIQTVCVAILIGIPGMCAIHTQDEEWNLTISGDHVSILPQEEYEEMTNYHRTENNFASVVDQQGQVWDGMPLWLLVGRVNDPQTDYSNTENPPRNDTRRQDYSVTISGSGVSSVTLPGLKIAQNDGYILANVKNGKPLSKNEPSYPLVLAGKDLSPDEMIKGVTKITVNLPLYQDN